MKFKSAHWIGILSIFSIGSIAHSSESLTEAAEDLDKHVYENTVDLDNLLESLREVRIKNIKNKKKEEIINLIKMNKFDVEYNGDKIDHDKMERIFKKNQRNTSPSTNGRNG